MEGIFGDDGHIWTYARVEDHFLDSTTYDSMLGPGLRPYDERPSEFLV